MLLAANASSAAVEFKDGGRNVSKWLWVGDGSGWKYKPTSSAGCSIPLPISLSLGALLVSQWEYMSKEKFKNGEASTIS